MRILPSSTIRLTSTVRRPGPKTALRTWSDEKRLNLERNQSTTSPESLERVDFGKTLVQKS